MSPTSNRPSESTDDDSEYSSAILQSNAVRIMEEHDQEAIELEELLEELKEEELEEHDRNRKPAARIP
jgi:hypothetical protein